MRHIKLYEDFDLDKFLSDPEREIHGEDNIVDIGSYVKTYRGNGRVLNDDGEFWIIDPIGTSSTRSFKVPKEGVEKIDFDEAKKIIGSSSSSANTKRELERINDEVESFLASTVTDEDGEWKYRGSIPTAMEFIEEIIVDLYSLDKRDSDMKLTDSFGKLVSNLAILFDNLLESAEDREELEVEIKRLIGEIQSF